jgi:SAM-dependent methyltransferase
MAGSPTPTSLYDHPQYYDLVFGSDWQAEYAFLRKVFKVHAGRPVERIFEPACGTGRLLIRLGRAGYRVSGLDLNRHAVEFCNGRLQSYRLPPSVHRGDMSNFRLRTKVDAAFNAINSFRHLLSEEQARSHLACISDSLAPGGLYILALHLTPTVGQPFDEERWGARRGHLAIATHLKTFELDLEKRTERCRMVMHVHTPKRSFDIVDELVFRTYTAPQMRELLATARELELVATYDFSYQIDEPIEIGPETQDIVLVLRKRAPARKRSRNTREKQNGDFPGEKAARR